MAITDSWLKANNKRPREKVEEKSDGGGLSVRATANGKLVFQMRFRIQGKAARLDLGTYPIMTLKEARTRHMEMRAELAEGKDPRRVAAARVIANQERDTFEGLFRRWYTEVLVKDVQTPEAVLRSFEIHVLPVFGKLSSEDVSLNMWMDLLDRVKVEAPTIATRILTNAKKLYRWAGRRELLPYHAILGISSGEDLGIRKGTRGRQLSEQEIRDFFISIDVSRMAKSNKMFLLCCLFLGCRNGELREMEIADLDLSAGTWTMPPKKNKLVKIKKKREDEVEPLVRTLTPTVVGFLKEARALSSHKTLVFGTRDPLNGLTSSTVLSFPYNVMRNYKRITGKEMRHWSLHDLRKTARSNWSPLTEFHVAEKMLGHVLPGVSKVYDYYDYLAEQKRVFEAWSDYLLTLRPGWGESSQS